MILSTVIKKDISKSRLLKNLTFPLSGGIFYLEGINMIKVKCKYCDYKLEKPRWEHIIHTIRKQGGNVGKNICPRCKRDELRLDWGEEEWL